MLGYIIGFAIFYVGSILLLNWSKDRKTVLRITLLDHIPLLLWLPAAFMGLLISFLTGEELTVDIAVILPLILFGPVVVRHLMYTYKALSMLLIKLDDNNFKLTIGAEEVLLNDETIESILIKTSPGQMLGHEHYLETIFTMKDGREIEINSLVVYPDYFLDKFTTLDKISETKSWKKIRHTTKPKAN